MKNTSEGSSEKILSALEVANYVVCPEAFRLKSQKLGKRQNTPRVAEAQSIRKEWVRQQDLSNTLRYYAKLAYALMVLLVVVLFLFERPLVEKLRRFVPIRQSAERPVEPGSLP